MKKIKLLISKLKIVFSTNLEDLEKGLHYSKLSIEERIELDTEEILKELRQLADQTDPKGTYLHVSINRFENSTIYSKKIDLTYYLQIGGGVEIPHQSPDLTSILKMYRKQIPK